ncbi:hypothetical protein [Bradyrhizobium sp. BR13661]|jgi:hypothetical protein|uniref:hypothetical protein n=1 Tax=Bradyrhizobium sp. BR13661 TaxID=2940622 RepID=UPI0024758012|nr:hypothetical protein [Bradyrhizobium sp. BR13661]MDH6262619.1 hypothetical protein [Bradyrhizobium sp. BR13661]
MILVDEELSVSGRAMRIVMVLSVGVMLMASSVSSVQARHATCWHAHRSITLSRQLVDDTSGKFGPMRYYGGPKSPMWRAPAN